MELRSVAETGWRPIPVNPAVPILDIVQPSWRSAWPLPREEHLGPAVADVDIVANDYVLHRLDQTGAIARSEIIDADTVAEALRQVVDRVDRSDRADYELWIGTMKLASIEATGNPEPVSRDTGCSWWQRLFAR
jgi:hypothetical protein